MGKTNRKNFQLQFNVNSEQMKHLIIPKKEKTSLGGPVCSSSANVGSFTPDNFKKSVVG